MIHTNFIGRLGKDAETLVSKNGKSFLKFSVAVDDYNYSTREKNTTWLNCISGAINLQPYLTKGRQVAILGRLTQSEYTNAEGDTVRAFSVLVASIQLLAPANPNRLADTNTPPPTQEQTKAERPKPRKTTATNTSANAEANAEATAHATQAAPLSDDDLPF